MNTRATCTIQDATEALVYTALAMFKCEIALWKLSSRPLYYHQLSVRTLFGVRVTKGILTGDRGGGCAERLEHDLREVTRQAIGEDLGDAAIEQSTLGLPLGCGVSVF